MNAFVRSLSILCLLVSVSFSILNAQPPKVITYQGHLLNDKGEPATGSMRMTFTLYPDSQTLQFVHQETQDVVIDKGLYSIQLGALKPFDISFQQQYFLSITIDGIESKRVAINPVPYAIKALGVMNSSIFPVDINTSDSKNGDVLLSDGNKVEWKPVVSKIIGDGSIQVNPVGGTVYVSIPEGAVSGNKIESNTINYDRFLVSKAPKNKQYLSYDSITRTLVWLDQPELLLTLPYKQQSDQTDTLFSIKNTRNGPAGRFAIETNPGTHHALIGENNGVGSAIAGFAKGNGNAGYFSLSNSTGTGSAVRVETNAKRHGVEVTNANSATINTSGVLSIHQSNADSSFGVTGVISHANPGANSAGLRGQVLSVGTKAIGVHGLHAGKGVAILGSTKSGIGIMGISEDSTAVFAKRTSSSGIIPAVYVESMTTADSASALTSVISAQQPGSSTTAILGEISSTSNSGIAIIGRHKGGGIGIEGNSKDGVGIRGVSSQSIGILGMHSALVGNQAGVQGSSASSDTNAVGVAGIIESTSSGLQSAGVRGINNSANANGYGVSGTHAGQGIGVYGTSQSGTAIQAYTSKNSNQGIGVKSIVDGNNAIALQARTTSTTGLQYGLDAVVSGDSAIAVRGKAPVNVKRTSYAGFFEGNLAVAGGDIIRNYQSASGTSEKRAMPIAYGSVGLNGAALSGTQNFTCNWDVNTQQYFIIIHQEGYTSSGYITVANASNATQPVIINTSQAGADMLAISCFNLQGQKIQFPFHFMVFKP
ncbi:MAG: hypothetical protein ACKOFB_00910 [bacterium]